MRGFIITGTDTGVGKTVVSAMLAVLLIENGFNVAVRKPIETGCTVFDNTLMPEDGLFCSKTGTHRLWTRCRGLQTLKRRHHLSCHA